MANHRQLLLEARRYARHVLKKLLLVQESKEEYDIGLDETVALANRMVTWLDELIETEENKDAELSRPADESTGAALAESVAGTVEN